MVISEKMFHRKTDAAGKMISAMQFLLNCEMAKLTLKSGTIGHI